MKKRPSSRSGQSRSEPPASTFRFSRTNALLGGSGLATVGLGYYLLSTGSINAAPILLVVGYGVLLPLALIR